MCISHAHTVVSKRMTELKRGYLQIKYFDINQNKKIIAVLQNQVICFLFCEKKEKKLQVYKKNNILNKYNTTYGSNKFKLHNV